MTRAKDISKIVTDADLSGTLDVTGEVTTADDIKFTSGSRHKFVGGGTGNNLELGTYSSSNTSRDVHLQIDSAGNVGIGTSSPNSRLTSASTDGSTGLSIHRTFSGNVSGETTIGGLDFTLTDTATSNQVVSRISPVGSAGTGDAFAGAMRFYTAGSNGSVAERMRIDSSGNVGIGISNPDDKLHVADSSNAELKLQTDNANGGSVVKFNRSGTDNSYIGTKGYFTGNSDNNLYLRANSGLGIQFYTNGNNERMRIDGSGNVGIGTSSPARKLHVGGTGSGQGELHLTNDTTGHTGSDGSTFTTSGSDLLILQRENANTRFYTNGSERMRIDNSGDYLFLGGTLRIKDSGNTAQRGAIYGDSSSFHINAGVNNLIAYSAGTERMRIHNNGLISVGNTSADAMINITNNYPYTAVRTNSNSTNGHFAIEFHNPNGRVGNITTTGSSTAYNTSSDHRLKENVTADWDATTRLKQLNPVRFNFIADADTTVDGFLAHEVQSVVPEAISGTHNEVDDDGNPVYQGIDQSKLVPLLVKTIQELEARIVALETA